MAKGYMLSGEYLDVLGDVVRWWRANRHELRLRRFPVRRPLAHQISRFELLEDLQPGGTAKAVRLVPDNADGWEDADPEHEVTVRDVLGTTRGKARDEDASPDPLKGTWVEAYKAHDHEDWEIVSAQPWPKVVQGLLDDDVLANSSTFKIKTVQTLFPVGATAIEHLLDNENKLTLHNVFGLDGREDALTFAVWNEEQVRYDALAPYLGGQILWAKVYGTFENVTGDECHPVEVVACDHDGGNAQLETFTILTHIKPRATTDLEDGDVVGYVRLVGVTIGESPSETDIAGIIVTDIWEAGSLTVRNDCTTPEEVENVGVLEFKCEHFQVAELTEGEGEAEETIGATVDLFAGEADAIIVHDGDNWIKLAPPITDAVLVYDTGQASGSRVVWKELDEFACPEEEA